jgi:hypothetical protein
MQIEMNIKGLMIDPITNMLIIILRDQEGQRIFPSGRSLRSQRDRPPDRERPDAPAMTHDLLKNIIDDRPPRWSASW